MRAQGGRPPETRTRTRTLTLRPTLTLTRTLTLTLTLARSVQPVLGDGYSRTLAAWLDNLEAQRVAMVAKYGSQFYEGFRAFYYVCVEARAAHKLPVHEP